VILELSRLVTEKSRSGGRHFYYRCATIAGNQKLAKGKKESAVKKDKEKFLTLIETRGEGGFSVCAPSDGYTLIQGDLTAIPVITPEERAILLEVARSFNECNEDGAICPVSCPKRSAPDVRKAVDHFNEKGDIRPFLEKHGWVFQNGTRPTRVPGIREHVISRPGVSHGSATFNGQYFYPFSTNSDPFEAERPYTKAAVFAYLQCGKDFLEAAKELKKLGFGQQRNKIVAQNYISTQYDFRYNVVKTKLEYRPKDGTWQEFPDRSYHNICMEVTQECDIECDVRTIRTPIISQGASLSGSSSRRP
jgi:hypothetical protein